MTILEIMERASTRETKLVIAWIKDAITQMQSDDAETISVSKQNIVKATDGDDNQYSLPAGLILTLYINLYKITCLLFKLCN